MADSKEALILETAQKLFARFGFNKTTVDEIARAAHIGKSTIYHYFKSKEDIFRAVVEKESDILSRKIREAVNRVQSPQEKLRAYILTRMRHLKELANFYSALKDEYLEHYSFIERAREQDFQRETGMVTAILKEGVDAGVFCVEDMDLTAFALITALKGLEYPWTIAVDMPDIEKNIDVLLNALFYGIVRK